MTVTIDGTKIGEGEPPFVIAEVGINARTDLELAERFIETAAECGADAVKFQTHIADSEMVEDEMRAIDAGGIYDTIISNEWSVDEQRNLKSIAENNGLTFLSTPFSTEAVDILEEIGVTSFKVGSGEMSNFQLLDYISRTGKPALISTGMHSWEAVKESINFLEGRMDKYALFYCVSEYPTDPLNFDFGTMERLREQADVPVGFSDHSKGVEAAKVAIGYGADIIEKHFTLDSRLPGPDQIVSIEPDDLADLCEFAELFHQTGTKRDAPTRIEQEIKSWAQHSIVSSTQINENEIFDEDNIITKRPCTGISARHYFDVIGSTASIDISAGMVITEDMIVR